MADEDRFAGVISITVNIVENTSLQSLLFMLL